MGNTKRAAARSKGLRLAARVATVGGIAVAALGLVEARAASAASATHAASVSADLASDGSGAATLDDTKPLPMEGWAKATPGAGGCGCAPCWGPPAPPRKATRRGRARARVATRPRAKRPARGPR